VAHGERRTGPIQSVPTRPTVTAVIPTFNASDWITHTLNSVLGQTDPPDEVIVVDDGSSDDTPEKVRAFGDRVIHVRQENRGAPAAYDRGFREASCQYVAPCPHDDLWESRKLEWQREALRRFPAIDVAIGNLTVFGAREAGYPRPPRDGLLDNKLVLPALYTKNFIAAPTAVIRRAFYERVGGYDTGIFIEDYEFWLRAVVHGAQLYYDPRVLARYRAHDSNLSRPSIELATLDYRIRRRYANHVDPKLAANVLTRDLRLIARWELERGDGEAARKAYSESLEFHRNPKVAVAVYALAFSPGRRLAVRRARRRPAMPA
jgi:glycosyltransferase involved in cell wall biosynthesis